MVAIAPVHPSPKKVVVADWDSEEEGRRSARGWNCVKTERG